MVFTIELFLFCCLLWYNYFPRTNEELHLTEYLYWSSIVEQPQCYFYLQVVFFNPSLCPNSVGSLVTWTYNCRFPVLCAITSEQCFAHDQNALFRSLQYVVLYFLWLTQKE